MAGSGRRPSKSQYITIRRSKFLIVFDFLRTFDWCFLVTFGATRPRGFADKNVVVIILLINKEIIPI